MNTRTILVTSAATAALLALMPLGADAAMRILAPAPGTADHARVASTTSSAPMRPALGLNHATTTPDILHAPKQTPAIAKAEARAEQEIARRVAALQALIERINNIHISDADKAALQVTMQGQIADLTDLKTAIASTTSTTTLKTAVQSITKSYRIYMLVIPQATIIAAADRVNQIVSQLQQLATKLAARIGSAHVATLSPLLADLNAQLTDAITEAQTAVSETSALVPDNGDNAKMKANGAALKDAAAKIKVAEKDLLSARKDAGEIVKGLGAPATASISTTTPKTASTSTRILKGTIRE